MLQNMNFKEEKKVHVIVIRKDPSRGPQNWQKDILQQKNVVAGENLPYGCEQSFAYQIYKYLSIPIAKIGDHNKGSHGITLCHKFQYAYFFPIHY